MVLGCWYCAAVPADLGPEATEADAAEYNAAVQRLAVAFGGDRTAASAWLWGEGDYLTRIESCPGPEEEES